MSAQKLIGETLNADICIVGGGAAGCVLAHSLLERGADVILIEAGGWKKGGAKAESLYRGESADPDFLLPPDRDRCRGLGGSSALWGGRCMPYDPLDFEARAHIPLSGFPFDHKELEPWYRAAQSYAECGRYNYDSATAGLKGQLIGGFDNPNLLTETLERWSPPTHFGKSLGANLKAAQKLRVITNGVATRLVKDGARIGSVEIHALRGKGQFKVQANRIVLSGGGLETVRLMLASDRIGDHSGWLGRGYMTHVGGVIAKLRFSDTTPVIFGYELDAEGVYIRRRLTFSREAQMRHKLPNFYALLDRPLLEDAEHGSAILSLTWLAKRFFQRQSKDLGKAGGGKFALYRDHFRNLIFGAPQALSVLPRFGRDRFLKGRRLPSLILPTGDNTFYLYFHAEQRPDWQSRVELDTRNKDALGMARLRIDARLTPEDAEAILRAHRLIGQELKAAGVGDLEFLDENDPMETLRQNCKATLGHHIGAARMSSTPSEGVVDANLKVHGLENLYVASAAALPVSSQAHPTLTVLALALRLGEHLMTNR